MFETQWNIATPSISILFLLKLADSMMSFHLSERILCVGESAVEQCQETLLLHPNILSAVVGLRLARCDISSTRTNSIGIATAYVTLRAIRQFEGKRMRQKNVKEQFHSGQMVIGDNTGF